MNTLVPIQKDFYGDDHRWFFGTVVNAHPPAGLEGRVKVRINGVHSPSTGDIPEKDLPWAQILIPTTEGGASGIGRIPQIVQGVFVFGMFMDGTTSQLPLILGSLSRVEYPSAVQTGRRNPDENAVDYTKRRLQNVVTQQFKDDKLDKARIPLRRQQSMKFFIDNGYDIMHAAAITGALQGQSQFEIYDESFLDAFLTPKLGIAGWKKVRSLGSRYNNLLKFAAQFSPNSDWKSFSLQLQFVLYELRTSFSQENSRLIATSNIKDASEVMNRYYLKNTGVSNRLAQQAYDEVIS